MAAETFLDAAKQHKNSLETILSDNKAIGEIVAFTKKILINPNRYEEPVPETFGPYRDPSKVGWSLKLSEWKGTGTKEFKGTFEFGSPRFLIAAGLSFSPMNAVQYARVDSPTAAGGKEVRVGRSNSSNFRALPMAMVHGRLNGCSVGRTRLYASVGVTAKADNKGTVPEYLLGLSTSFINERIFLTGGVYLGQQQNLQGGLREGDVVPSTLSELPVAKGYRSGFGFAVTYRFK